MRHSYNFILVYLKFYLPIVSIAFIAYAGFFNDIVGKIVDEDYRYC